jgi:hypothetical protein
MKDAEILRCDGKDYLKLTNPKAFDAEAFIAAHPDLAATYQKLDTTALREAEPDVYNAFMRDGLGARRIVWLGEAKKLMGGDDGDG